MKPAPTTPCQQFIQDNQLAVAWNSGKTITQLGLYDGCEINSKELKYGLLEFFNSTTKIPLGIQMGICLPQICSKTQIQFISNQILNSSAGITGLYIESPQNIAEGYEVQKYVALAIFGIVLLMFISGSLLSFLPGALKQNKILKAFNLKKNLQAFKYKEHNFNVFNGVKSLCMMWVIFGHLFSTRLQNNVNALSIQSHVEGWFYLFVLSAFFAVDVFFYIGGFLVAYSFMRNKMRGIIKYPLAIVHRVLRFWPSYLMAMIFFYGFMIHLGSGPLWWKVQAFSHIEHCNGMWKSMLFVDNIVDNGEKMCMEWGWYLQNDMQIFILSIPILFIYAKKRMYGYITILALILLSLTANFVQVQANQYITVAHRPDFIKWSLYFPNVYIKPWIRCPPYFYGLILGLLFMQFKKEEQQPLSSKGFFMKLKERFEENINQRRIVQILGLLIILFVILIPRTLQVGVKWPQVLHSLYLTFGKLFFVIGVSMLVTPSVIGIKNDLVFFLMDTKIFHFIGKVSFWTYLIHFNFIVIIVFSQKVDFYYNVVDILSLYFPIAIISIAFGFIGTVLVETPFANMQKMLFAAQKKKQQKVLKEQDKINESVSPTKGKSFSNSLVTTATEASFNV